MEFHATESELYFIHLRPGSEEAPLILSVRTCLTNICARFYKHRRIVVGPPSSPLTSDFSHSGRSASTASRIALGMDRFLARSCSCAPRIPEPARQPVQRRNQDPPAPVPPRQANISSRELNCRRTQLQKTGQTGVARCRGRPPDPHPPLIRRAFLRLARAGKEVPAEQPEPG